MNFYIPWWTHHGQCIAHHRAVRQDVGTSHQGHTLAVHTLSYQSFHCQPMTVTHVIGYNSETPLRH